MMAKRKKFTMETPPTPPSPELLSVRQLAARLGCGEGTVRRRARAGIWQSVIMNGSMRFTAPVVAAILAERRNAEAAVAAEAQQTIQEISNP